MKNVQKLQLLLLRRTILKNIICQQSTIYTLRVHTVVKA